MGWVLSREPTEICNPLCRFFRCGKSALDIKRDPPWCNWVNAPCIGYKCPFANCAQLKLLFDGRCALFVKRKTNEDRDLTATVPGVGASVKSKKKLEDLGVL
ncbi:MAG: hypothetical protein NZ920_01515 [Aigarchaeota archaeon]|nr:hypothetical protein [Aigarchaeota archaeon]MDW8093120.1 hypothetical protein [Nitrososphaerota archaeon]